MGPHDPIVCLQRLRAHVRACLAGSSWFDGEPDPEAQLAAVCHWIAKAATDPQGFSWVRLELSVSDAVLQRSPMPPSKFSRADRLELLEQCYTFVTECFPKVIKEIQAHLGPDETPPIDDVPQWIMNTFVRPPEERSP
jgi:hypothetical protein